jgi:hypothetical protein
MKKLQDKGGLPQGTEDAKKNIEDMLKGIFKK